MYVEPTGRFESDDANTYPFEYGSFSCIPHGIYQNEDRPDDWITWGLAGKGYASSGNDAHLSIRALANQMNRPYEKVYRSFRRLQGFDGKYDTLRTSKPYLLTRVGSQNRDHWTYQLRMSPGGEFFNYDFSSHAPFIKVPDFLHFYRPDELRSDALVVWCRGRWWDSHAMKEERTTENIRKHLRLSRYRMDKAVENLLELNMAEEYMNHLHLRLPLDEELAGTITQSDLVWHQIQIENVVPDRYAQPESAGDVTLRSDDSTAGCSQEQEGRGGGKVIDLSSASQKLNKKAE